MFVYFQTNLNYILFMKGFYNRIESISTYYNYKSVNDFALSGLAYKSSEKLNRLKNDDNTPSVKIILDISNKFEKINTNWLLTGKGTMFIPGSEKNLVSEPQSKYNKYNSLEEFSELEIVEYIYSNKDKFYKLQSFNELVKDVPEEIKVKEMERMITELKDLKIKLERMLPKK